MKKFFSLIFLGLVLTILDNSFAPFLSIHGFYPSFATIFIICFAIINGSEDGLWYGVYIGLLQDVFFFKGFGINALTNMIICVIAGYLGKHIFKEKSFIPILTNLVLSLTKGILIFLLMFLFGFKLYPLNILGTSICNMLLSIFLYKCIYKFCNIEFMKKKWNFKEW